jgi:hypothetical protein
MGNVIPKINTGNSSDQMFILLDSTSSPHLMLFNISNSSSLKQTSLYGQELNSRLIMYRRLVTPANTGTQFISIEYLTQNVIFHVKSHVQSYAK